MMVNVSDETKRILTDVNYPADKDEIVSMMEKENAPKNEMEMARKLPDREYSDMNEVMGEMKKMMM